MAEKFDVSFHSSFFIRAIFLCMLLWFYLFVNLLQDLVKKYVGPICWLAVGEMIVLTSYLICMCVFGCKSLCSPTPPPTAMVLQQPVTTTVMYAQPQQPGVYAQQPQQPAMGYNAPVQNMYPDLQPGYPPPQYKS